MKQKLSPWCKTVKHMLIDKDMSITDLANALNLSRAHVSLVVNGKRYSQPTINQISSYLNISNDYRKTVYRPPEEGGDNGEFN